MKIIKEAFVEGRETEIEWEKSQAKKNDLKLDIALENFSVMKKREIFTPMPLHQVCPATGKVLQTFPTRLAAARYIVNEILKTPEKNPISITGNMEMCMRSGWKAYGFYWKLATPATLIKYTKPTPVNAKKIFATYCGNGGVFPSIQAVANSFGISTKIIANQIKPNSKRKAYYTFQEYNPELRTLTFDTMKQAADYANVGDTPMRRWVKQGKPINNTIYKIKNFKGKITPKYVLFQGNKIIGKFLKAKDVAEIVGVHRATISKKIKTNQTLGEFNQYRIKLVKE